MTPDAFCREVEAYLTRKNDGHLVRIVGPSFDRVRGWAERGVPLKVAFHGIDRHFERYYAKGPRRRPVHVDHCEADVLDAFDAWRRAVGVSASSGEGDRGAHRPRTLAAGIERALARLTALRAAEPPPVPATVLEDAVGELDALLPAARTARGAARMAIQDRMAATDAALIRAARAALDEGTLADLRRQAAGDLAPFRERMPTDAWERSLDAAVERAIRQRARLPSLASED